MLALSDLTVRFTAGSEEIEMDADSAIIWSSQLAMEAPVVEEEDYEAGNLPAGLMASFELRHAIYYAVSDVILEHFPVLPTEVVFTSCGFAMNLSQAMGSLLGVANRLAAVSGETEIIKVGVMTLDGIRLLSGTPAVIDWRVYMDLATAVQPVANGVLGNIRKELTGLEDVAFFHEEMKDQLNSLLGADGGPVNAQDRQIVLDRADVFFSVVADQAKCGGQLPNEYLWLGREFGTFLLLQWLGSRDMSDYTWKTLWD